MSNPLPKSRSKDLVPKEKRTRSQQFVFSFLKSKNSSTGRQKNRFTDQFGGWQESKRTTLRSRSFRPISTSSSMHLVLKTRNALGDWSFLKAKNKRIIRDCFETYSEQYGVKILSLVNVGNHLHLQVRIKSRQSYMRFIRVITGAIALKITGSSKSQPLRNKCPEGFWTQRPFTRFVHGLRDFLGIQDYFQINKLQGWGWSRRFAEMIVRGMPLSDTG